MVRKNYVGLVEAMLENLNSKNQLKKQDFQLEDEWEDYKIAMNRLRLAISRWYCVGKDDKEARDRFYEALRALYALIAKGSDKYIPGTVEEELKRYSIVAGKVTTVKLDTEESCKYADEHVWPLSRDIMLAQLNGASPEKIDEMKLQLKEAKREQSALMAVKKDVVGFSENTARKCFEAILALNIKEGKLTTAEERDAINKAKKVEREAQKKAAMAAAKAAAIVA